MSIAIDSALTDRVAALIREIEATEAARPPIEQEVAAVLTHLEAIAARAEVAAPSMWLSPSPAFSTSVFSNSMLAFGMLIEPDKTRLMIAARAKRQAEAWRGLRLAEGEKQRLLARLQTDLRVARAKLEKRRREIEEQTLEVLPRVNDDPSIWLLPPAQLDELAATGNGRQR